MSVGTTFLNPYTVYTDLKGVDPTQRHPYRLTALDLSKTRGYYPVRAGLNGLRDGAATVAPSGGPGDQVVAIMQKQYRLNTYSTIAIVGAAAFSIVAGAVALFRKPKRK